ncbi:hybrid sensor histidine kinase/response regulator [Plectonema cf. radiosum LEGE 06105]|uniref:histidine kinase n=1 Tax=Plectonema cf. radiosum LEGE 06105 TaxID=945769 RepID=A0A8J7F3U0_9CYAN|nr:hybrid sensor histidine kinase/response regulator [Plectonema radiosum]MBE9213528.1 hybrid sensor histidine kinase/response regulator [Plectonema cf. radiosum LEGE 06105]
MITDSSIREQGYLYFLSEAPELLQTIEQELFSLVEERSTNKVHNLMRATHTLKGGAANVELESITKIAHSLEDVFKALYNPEVEIDSHLYSLLLQAFECLQLCLTSEMMGTKIDDDELMQRAASVFAQLQEKLGDAFGAEAHIPTSEELGFDIVLSIFETGVTQRIDSIQELLKNPPATTEIAGFLRTQAEVFTGLSESLNLPGFGQITQAILAALEANPSQALEIAKIANRDLQQARKAVLNGDRERGGEPSQALLAFLQPGAVNYQDETEDLSVDSKNESLETESFSISLRKEIEQLYEFFTTGNLDNEPLKPKSAKFHLKVIRYILSWFNHELDIPKENLGLHLLIPKDNVEKSMEYVENWLQEFIEFLQDDSDSQNLYLYRIGGILTVLLAVAKFKYYQGNLENYLVIETLQTKIADIAKQYKNYSPVAAKEKNWLDSPKLKKLLEIKKTSPTIAVNQNENIVEAIWGEEVTLTPPCNNSTSAERLSPVNSIINNHTIEDTKTGFESDTVVNRLTKSKSLACIDDNDIDGDSCETIIEFPINSVTKTEHKIEEKSPTTVRNSKLPAFVRVDVESLQRLNYLAGELLIYQKRRTSQDEQLREIIKQLSKKLQKHQQTLEQLQELPLYSPNLVSRNTLNVAFVDFDCLEMDDYTEFHLGLHEVTEQAIQLQEIIESANVIVQQSSQIHDKKQRLTLAIIDNLVEARMLPLGNILNRFPQMVQNLNNVHGKNVKLQLSGGGVLVDKAIAEKLYEPLLHLVRNSYDHGIEPAKVRCDRGKSEQGLIEICAYNRGSQTVIEVRDDGGGLNFEKIRAKAIELGFLRQDREFDKHDSILMEELLDCLFAPGFSTASKVSDISGRGIGLDIVRAQLQALNGSIAVYSQPQQGTTFVLKMPFSMTTEKLMIVQTGGAAYALLLDSIAKILLPSPEQIKQFENKKVLYWNTGKEERMVNLLNLSDLIQYNRSFNSENILHNQSVINHAEQTVNPILLLRNNDQILGLEIDQIIGEQELVVRPLGQAIAPPKYVYGCSSLANGNLILVIDGTLLPSMSEMQASIDYMVLPSSASLNKKALQMSGEIVTSKALLTASKSTNNPQITSENPVKSPKIVLVVDDAISLRQTISLTLQKYGYQVIQAQNGVEALEKLQHHPQIDLVISDLEMPRMNGFELLSNLRQNSDLANLPVVVLTSRSAEKHRQLAQALGANAYLTKPYLEHEFLSKVEQLVMSN